MHPHMRKIPYTIDSFTYVGRIINSPYLVYVAKDAPWNTFNEMIRRHEGCSEKVFLGLIRCG